MASPDIPYLSENEIFHFPPTESSSEEGVVGVGGNLSPGMLISAYRQGIFPWYSEGQPIIWWSPDPRFVLFPNELHISRSMKRYIRKDPFTFSVDRCFERVIHECGRAERPGQDGTWITGEMVDGYIRLHELGYAHSFEVWQGEQLAGGLYGVSLGSMFFGESMFSSVPNASKAALIVLSRVSNEIGFSLIDCQVQNAHMRSMGARTIPRRVFLSLLKKGLESQTLKGSWTHLIIVDTVIRRS